MKGTVKYNLDPFDNHTDAEIRDVMTRSHLSTALLSAEVRCDAPFKSFHVSLCPLVRNALV